MYMYIRFGTYFADIYLDMFGYGCILCFVSRESYGNLSDELFTTKQTANHGFFSSL
jgi:hypothetical protein